MITTTNRQRVRVCSACRERAVIAAFEMGDGGINLCFGCYDKAGDENAVSDGHMTCDQFRAKYGDHSEYCPGHDLTVTLTVEQHDLLVRLLTAEADAAHLAVSQSIVNRDATAIAEAQVRRGIAENLRSALWAAAAN